MPGPSQESEVDALRRVAIDACEQLFAAQSELSVQLAHHVETTQGMVDTMASGGSLRDTLHAFRSDEVRPAVSSVIRDFE